MIHCYVSNDSYPELREIRSRWMRHRIWWRAFASALTDRGFWRFVAVQAAVAAAWLAVDRLVLAARVPLPHWIAAMLAAATWAALSLTWGGDLMRPHLRRVSPIARNACPGCGHQLTAHLATPDDVVRCPECGARSPRAVFSEPYAIPRRFLACRFGATR